MKKVCKILSMMGKPQSVMSILLLLSILIGFVSIATPARAARKPVHSGAHHPHPRVHSGAHHPQYECGYDIDCPPGPPGEPGPQGPPGQTGQSGPPGQQGPVYAAANSGSQPITTNTSVVSVPVPAGSYSVTASVPVLLNADSTVRCRIQPPSGTASIALSEAANESLSTATEETLTLTAALTVATPTTISYVCNSVGLGSASNLSGGASITAIQVGAVLP